MKARIVPRSDGLTLSVGMIVKNEEKYLDKCLSALKSILDNVPSELVIVDTGSTDSTVKIAHKYTDKIYYFDWVDDFSAARNYGLEKCKGDWFMFIDADEVFDGNCEDIIAFFNDSKALASFNSAVYNCRNYYDTDCAKWSTMTQYRIVKRLPGLRFIHPIHEFLEQFPEPTYVFETFAHHYGYAYESEAQRTKKLMRNLPLLLKELEKDPDDLRTYLHIFSGIDDEERIKFLPIMIEKARRQTSLAQAAGVFVQAIEFYYEKTNNIDIVSDYIDEYLTLFTRKNALMLEVMACKGLTHLRKGENDSAAEAFREYLSLFQLYEEGKLDMSGIETLPLTFLEKSSYSQVKDVYEKIKN